jgi:hypothetical protein
VRALYAQQCVQMAEKDRDLFEVKKKNSELEEYIIQASLFLLCGIFFFDLLFH